MSDSETDARRRDWMLVLSHLFVQNEKMEEAATVLKFLRIFFPEDKSAFRLLLYVYLQLKQSKNALALSDGFSKLSLSNKDLEFLRFIRSRAYYDLGMQSRAHDILAEGSPPTSLEAP